MKKVILVLALFICTGVSAQMVHETFNVDRYGTVNALVYKTSSEKAPTLICFPGNGESGTDVKKLYTHLPTGFIRNGWKPDFNVIAIQPRGNGTQTHINYMHAFLKWATSKSYVDTNNLFLTGLSGGAAMIFEYIKKHPTPVKINGIIPMSITTDANCELTTSDLSKKLCGTDLRYAAINAYGFCGRADSHFGKMKRFFDRLAYAKFPASFYEYTGGHSGWSTYYNPSWKNEEGQSIYEWMKSKYSTDEAPPTTVNDTALVLYALSDNVVKVDTAAIITMTGDRKEVVSFTLGGTVFDPKKVWVQILHFKNSLLLQE